MNDRALDAFMKYEFLRRVERGVEVDPDEGAEYVMIHEVVEILDGGGKTIYRPVRQRLNTGKRKRKYGLHDRKGDRGKDWK